MPNLPLNGVYDDIDFAPMIFDLFNIVQENPMYFDGTETDLIRRVMDLFTSAARD